MRKLLIGSILLISYINANSQDAYINNTGDTIRGKVTNYLAWTKNPNSINFKDNNGSDVTLTPLTCKGFKVASSDVYTTYSGTRILNSADVDDIHSLKSSVLTTENINAFLRVIYQYNNFALYEYVDSKRINFFLGKNDTIKELEYFQYVDDNNHLQEEDTYKGYILKQLKDVPASDKQNKINDLVYQKQELINFFARILNDKQNNSEKRRAKYANNVFVGVGVHGNFGSIDYGDGTKASQTAVAPSVEVGLRLYSQRNFGKFFFQPELVYTVLNNDIVRQNKIEFKTHATFISGKFGPGYFFVQKPQVKVYAAFLVGLDFIFDYKTTLNNGTYHQDDKNDGTITKLTFNPEIGFVIGHSINIALQGTLPYKLPLLSNLDHTYKIYGAGIVARYMF